MKVVLGVKLVLQEHQAHLVKEELLELLEQLEKLADLAQQALLDRGVNQD